MSGLTLAQYEDAVERVKEIWRRNPRNPAFFTLAKEALLLTNLEWKHRFIIAYDLSRERRRQEGILPKNQYELDAITRIEHRHEAAGLLADKRRGFWAALAPEERLRRERRLASLLYALQIPGWRKGCLWAAFVEAATARNQLRHELQKERRPK